MKTTTLLLTLLLLTLSGCKKQETKTIENKSEFIEISKDKFNKEQMAFSAPVKKIFESTISITGKIVPDINGRAKISAPIEGTVKKIHVQVGQYVNEGDVILEIGGTDLINIQQDLATSSAKIKQLEANYKRTKKLYADKIKTENEIMMVESAYHSELANYGALKLKLKSIGLEIDEIEKGTYATTYQVTSPIKGQVVATGTTLGEYITAQEDIAEIINTDKIQIQLAIFESDVSAIQAGQKVQFITLGQEENPSIATISRVGKLLNPASRSFDCFASITPSDNDAFIINQVVRAEVRISTDTVWAVPHDAIITLGQNQYVYIKEKESKDFIHLSKVKVKVGKANNDFIELTNFPQDQMILVSGTDNVKPN